MDKITISFDAVPFKLVNTNNDESIQVIDAKQATKLTLEAVYEHFEPVEGRSVAQFFIDWFQGYQLQGVYTKEEMLKVGTALNGVGQIVMSSDGQIQLQPPKNLGYYLTSDDIKILIRQDPFVKHIWSKATIWRNLCIILAIGAGILAAYDLYKKYHDNVSDYNDTSGNYDNGQCVICIANEREVVFLECKHFCVCTTCASELILCPLCRQPIIRKIKIFQ